MKTDKKDLILNSTEELMCKMPDKDITMNLIAKQAGMGKASLYYYYSSKDEIIDAVIERSYKLALHEYFKNIETKSTALEKMELLFKSMLKKEFMDKRNNFILSLHLNESPALHNQMKSMAVSVVSPVMTELLVQGIKEGTIHTETPEESAEMIVASITFLLDDYDSSDKVKMFNKLKILAKVLETSLCTEQGSFNFLFEAPAG